MNSALVPRNPVPALNVPLVQGGRFVLGAQPGGFLVRPQFQDLLAAVDFAISKDYPARGGYTGDV